MSNSLPVSRVVKVSVALTPAGAQAQSLSDLLVLGNSPIIDPVERFRIYASLAGVAADFGTMAAEYLAAASWFAQSPQPNQLLIGRWIQSASKGGIRGGPLTAAQKVIGPWAAIANGGFKLMKDGGALTNITGLNFTGLTNLNAVAALIQAALITALPNMTCVWNAAYSRFEIESSTTGVISAVSFLVAPTAGTDISAMLGMTAGYSGAYLYQGLAAETAADCVALFDNQIGQKFYGVNFTGLLPDAGANTTQLLAAAAFIQGSDTKHVLAITTLEGGVLVAATTTDIAYQLKQLGYNRTMVQYSSVNPNAVVSLMARILTTNYRGTQTVITLKFKQEPGVIAEALTVNQANAAEAKNANVFVLYNNDTAIVEQGVMADGTFADIVMGTDWAATDVQRSLYNLLYTSITKIPQTEGGMQLLKTAVAAVMAQAVENGLVAPGVWNSNGFGTLKQGDYLDTGFYIWSGPINTQNQADRAARMATPIQVAMKLAGAIHYVDVSLRVNQ